LNRDFLSILYGRHLLIDAEQLPQFKFGSKLRQRVERAQELLRTGGRNISLTDAGLQAGFSSQSHLTRCFREVCGMTPGEFLRKER
jgi:transcriptional regulator GlxA family with amidase domain